MDWEDRCWWELHAAKIRFYCECYGGKDPIMLGECLRDEALSVVTRYQANIWKVAMLLCDNHESVAQEVFAQVARALPRQLQAWATNPGMFPRDGVIRLTLWKVRHPDTD